MYHQTNIFCQVLHKLLFFYHNRIFNDFFNIIYAYIYHLQIYACNFKTINVTLEQLNILHNVPKFEITSFNS